MGKLLPKLVIFAVCAWTCTAQPAPKNNSPVLRVGVAGSEPFVVDQGSGYEGISIEVWQAIASQIGVRYQLQHFESVPTALSALMANSVDVVVGPVSVTAARARQVRFSQPYFQSSLSILSGSENPSFWQRIRPFFSYSFFVAVVVLLLVLALVGTLIWLAERRNSPHEFPRRAVPGIANGVWLAIVTMTTVGYGDRAPKTFLGRLVTGTWMIVSLITATSLIAGIASTLTLTGMRSTKVTSAEQLHNKTVAVEPDSPGEEFARRYGAKAVSVSSVRQGYRLISNNTADAMVFDRPQLLYYGSKQHSTNEFVSKAEYNRQAYAFAFPTSSTLIHSVNVSLLSLEESGRVDRIIKEWLGDQAEN